MHTPIRSRTVRLAAALAAAVVVVGCGGDDDDAVSTAPTVQVTDGPAATAVLDTTADTKPLSTTEAVETSDATETTDAAETTAAESTVGPESTAAESTVVADGYTFTSVEGDYSALFPAEPTQQTQPVALPDGSSIDIVLAGLEIDDGFLGTARGKYPDGNVLDVPAALQGAEDQALANVNGTLTSSQDITLQGRPGREFSASITNNGQSGTLLQRVYLDGLVIYQQIFTGAGEVTFTDPAVAPFFESFTFTTG